MILPELLIYMNRFLNESSGVRGRNQSIPEEQTRMTMAITDRRRSIGEEQTRMTINVLATMAVSFLLGMAALLVLAGSTLSQSMVAGAVATGVAFVNLVRRPPDESLNDQ